MVKQMSIRITSGAAQVNFQHDIDHPISVLSAHMRQDSNVRLIGMVIADGVVPELDLTNLVLQNSKRDNELQLILQNQYTEEHVDSPDPKDMVAYKHLTFSTLATGASEAEIHIEYEDRYELVPIDTVLKQGDITQIGLERSAGNEFFQVGNRFKVGD